LYKLPGFPPVTIPKGRGDLRNGAFIFILLCPGDGSRKINVRWFDSHESEVAWILFVSFLIDHLELAGGRRFI
jgi:hypothetical protein